MLVEELIELLRAMPATAQIVVECSYGPILSVDYDRGVVHVECLCHVSDDDDGEGGR